MGLQRECSSEHDGVSTLAGPAFAASVSAASVFSSSWSWDFRHHPFASCQQTTLTFRIEIAHQLASHGTVEGSQRLQLQIVAQTMVEMKSRQGRAARQKETLTNGIAEESSQERLLQWSEKTMGHHLTIPQWHRPTSREDRV